MESFINGDLVALLGEVACAGEAGGAGSYDGNAVAVGRSDFGSFGAVGIVPVGNESFKPADADGFALDAAYALGFALGFLGAYPAANSGEG